MKLVETITLTQEYIDNEENYLTVGSLHVLRIMLNKQLEKNAIIKFVMPAVEDWYTSKPTIIVGINSLGRPYRTVFRQKLEPTKYYPYSAAFLKCTALSDSYLFETIMCKYSDNQGLIYSGATNPMYFGYSNDSFIGELNVYGNDASFRLNAGTTIKIYSE